MMNSVAAKTVGSGPVRRVWAALLSLVLPGAGHFLLGAFRRGAAWAVGLAVLQLLLLFATLASPVIAIVLRTAVFGLGRVATAIDAAKLVIPRPSWRTVLLAWVALWVLFNGHVCIAIYYKTHYAETFAMRSSSMQPTLLVGDSILVDKSAYRDRTPQRGDLVVFLLPPDERHNFIHRVIGLPGEQILLRGNQVFVDGRPLQESYVSVNRSAIAPPARCAYGYGCEPTTVPRDSYFVMGDNRDNSYDSRYWGFVRREKIKGRAVTVYWSWDTERRRPRFDRIGHSL